MLCLASWITESPGPDGFGSGFFRELWYVVGETVTDAVLEFIRTGKMLKQLNSTILTLIPKVSEPDVASHFQPTSL